MFFGFVGSAFASSSKYFIVTAYYSPLPNQDYYIMGDYESEIRMNGKGIAGASGKSVFSGMLAAPGKYSFGTKIYLEGLGIGSVEDRGQAIVPAGERGYEHDRIDVWVGYGDEGLRRAMYWGKRKIKGSIVSPYSKTTLDNTTLPAPLWTSKWLKKNLNKVAEMKESDIFSESLYIGSDSKRISRLQNILKDLGYLVADYKGGEYDDATITAVLDFQISAGLLGSIDDLGAGRYGPKTRSALKNVYELYLEQEKRKESVLALLEKNYNEEINKLKKVFANFSNLQKGDISTQVRDLQNILKELEVYEYSDTAIFGDITRDSIIDYQISRSIISSIQEDEAGSIGEKTKKIMIEELAKKRSSENLEKQDIYREYLAYKKDSE